VAGENQIPRDPFKLRLAIWLARAFSRFLWLFSRRTLYLIADAGGLLIYMLFPTYRENVRSNVSHVLGPDASEREIRRTTRNVFRTSARNFADLTRVPHLTSEQLLKSIHIEPECAEILDRVSSSGKGAVLVTAHFGAFDYVGQILWLRGYDVTLLTARTVPEFIDAGVTYLRGSRGARMEPATPGGVRRVLMALKRGRLIGIVADRDFFQNGKPVSFFGTETTLPPGPIRIARDSGAPVVPVFARRVGGGYVMHVEEPFTVEKTGDSDEDIRRGLARLVEVFERQLKSAPDQWVMFQRVWTAEPQQAVRVFPIGSPLDGKILGPSHEERGPLTDDSPENVTRPAQESEPRNSAAPSMSQYPNPGRSESTGNS
jgi:lauroyl/myristoyl acyltransferase